MGGWFWGIFDLRKSFFYFFSGSIAFGAWMLGWWSFFL